MLICIDSCVFIRGLSREQSDARHLINLIGPDLRVVIHRVIVSEVMRNLRERKDTNIFFSLFRDNLVAHIIEGPIPKALVDKYIGLGLAEKGDAYIGAFVEWMQVDYLISDNRHFLQEVRTDAYRLVTPAEFLAAINPT